MPGHWKATGNNNTTQHQQQQQQQLQQQQALPKHEHTYGRWKNNSPHIMGGQRKPTQGDKSNG
jgi:hypothetical protein